MTDLAGTYTKGNLRALQQSKENCSGSVRKGIEAIELKMQGYSSRDIAERYHVKPNYITACISRAQKHLRQDVVLFVRSHKGEEQKGELTGDYIIYSGWEI